jgi:hypothetical protein
MPQIQCISTGGPDSDLGACVDLGLAPVRSKRHRPFVEPNRIAGIPCRPLWQGRESGTPVAFAEQRFSLVGAPCPREEATGRIGRDTERLVVGV